MRNRSVAIIGTGNVGTAAAYAIFNQKLANEILLIDKDKSRAKGEALDLMHGQMLVGNIAVEAGDYKDLKDMQTIIIAAGTSQSSSSDNRLSLLNSNIAIFREIIAKIDEHCPDATVIIATNPVDILTYATQKLSKRPAERIIGTGTLLDTARFRALLGKHYNVDPRSVHAYILGEHGDSEVPIWSQASIGGKPIKNKTVLGKQFNQEQMQSLFEHTKNAAYEIIDLKGHTDTAIGIVIARIIRAIFENSRSIMPLSVDTNGSYGIDDICLSLPCSVGAAGIEGHVLPDITDKEKDLIRHSASILKERVEELNILSN